MIKDTYDSPQPRLTSAYPWSMDFIRGSAEQALFTVSIYIAFLIQCTSTEANTLLIIDSMILDQLGVRRSWWFTDVAAVRVLQNL